MGTGRKLRLHYRRNLDDYDGWELWLWKIGEDCGEGFVVKPLVHKATRTPYRDVFGKQRQITPKKCSTAAGCFDLFF